jgi:DNA-binding transcriptional ArsR family regulator
MTETVLEMPAAADLELTQVLQALSDPVRLEIVDALASGGEQACGAMPLPVSASTRSHHFRILRDAGVTVTRAVGNQRLVSLRRDDLEQRFPGLLDAVLRAGG